ncbi:MAG TPA: hypothetical protein VGC40_08415 [Paenirhodobacter sp.]
MVRKSHLGRALRRYRAPVGLAMQSPVENCLAQIDRACREIAFCELADMLSKSRITALRGALSGCREEELRGEPGLQLTSRTLAAELVSLEQTLPLEQAYRADQRDLAIARLNEAQKRLRVGRAADVGDDETLLARVKSALAISAMEVVTMARHKAAARVGMSW